jgi:two-component system, LuxR family, response regulator FixJ
MSPDERMASSTRTPLVYVIDDDADVLRSLRFLLETDGFEVRTFPSGEALLNTLTSGGADCFVIDHKMPRMTGIELADVLRGRKIDAPIILISGYPDGNIPTKAAAAGISRVLLKPHVEESLVTQIWDAIDARRSPSLDHLRDST